MTSHPSCTRPATRCVPPWVALPAARRHYHHEPPAHPDTTAPPPGQLSPTGGPFFHCDLPSGRSENRFAVSGPGEVGSQVGAMAVETNPPPRRDISDPTRRMRRRELSQFAPEEVDRILRRRERNKVAATKCRHKRHAQHEHLVKELQSMECENTSLTYEIRQLQRQRQALSDVLRHHQMSCTTRLQVNPMDTPPDGKAVTQSGIPGPYPLPYNR